MKAPRKTLIFAAAILTANLGGAYLLDALALVEGLLSPSGARLVWLVPLAGLFYLARLIALFAAPGLVLGAAVSWALDRRSRPEGGSARR